jgi:hypothetical protein
MTTAPSRLNRVRAAGGLALAATLLITVAPVATADEPVNHVAGFEIVSATIDMGADVPTITYTFRCLEPVDFIRIRSDLAQRHAGVDAYASSSQTSGTSACAAGATVTLPVAYGRQQGTFHPGPAAIKAHLYAYVGAYTVDFEDVSATVLLRPSRMTR